MIGYWALLSFVPVPGVGAISFAPGKNWANYIDLHFLPGQKFDGGWDPEGLLSTLPAVATCMLGVLAAKLLKNQRASDLTKVGCLIVGGLAALALGYAWGLQFPIIKKIWTSSYVLVAGGYSFLLLGAFYLVIDVWKAHRWATPFVWIGTNAITLYLLHNMVDFPHLAARLANGDLHAALGDPLGNVLLTGVSLALTFALARFWYKHGVFLRV